MGMLGNDLDTTDGVVLLSEDQDTQLIQMQISDVFAIMLAIMVLFHCPMPR